MFLLLMGAGCGGSGSLGRNSDVVVRLLRTDGTQVMTQFEIFLTRAADTSLDQNDPEDFVSTVNQPTWIDQYGSSRSASELQVSFRTRSDQVPYYIFVRVPNTGAQFETLDLRIDVDGEVGQERSFDLDISQTSRLVGVRIDRNDATY